MTFSETDDQMTLQFSGGDINNDTSLAIAIGGKYWTGTAAFTEGAGILFDDVSISGNFTHISGPHSGDGMGGTMTYKMEMTGLLFDDPDISLKPNPSIHLGNRHLDIWTGTSTEPLVAATYSPGQATCRAPTSLSRLLWFCFPLG